MVMLAKIRGKKALFRQIGKRVKLLRKFRGLTTTELASKARIKPQKLKEIEQGAPVTLWELVRLAAALDVQTQFLLTGEAESDDRNILERKLEQAASSNHLGVHEQEEQQVFMLSQPDMTDTFYSSVIEFERKIPVLAYFPPTRKAFFELVLKVGVKRRWIGVLLDSVEIDNNILDPQVRGLAIVEPIDLSSQETPSRWVMAKAEQKHTWILSSVDAFEEERIMARVSEVLVVPV